MSAFILLLACIPIDGPRILGADVAPTGLLPQIPADAVLGFSPSPGVRRIFNLQSLRRIAVRHGLAPPASGEICFERKTASLDPLRLEEAMRLALNAPDAEISIADFSRYPAPQGEIVFRRQDLRSLDPHSRSPVIWRGCVIYDDSKRFAVWARVLVTVPVTRTVAASDISVGDVVQPMHLRTEVSRGFPSAQPAMTLEDVVGKRAKRLIRGGAPLEPRFLEVEPAIRRGQTVQVRVQRGAASLALTATAQADAQLGQPVPLRNHLTGKTFRGRVQSRDLVVIEE
jgi:flagella basal body P-ring formation protein FlgA